MKERKIVDYCTVLKRNYIKDFDDSINAKIRTGWQPIGGLATVITQSDSDVYYIQALVKYEEPQEEEL